MAACILYPSTNQVLTLLIFIKAFKSDEYHYVKNFLKYFVQRLDDVEKDLEVNVDNSGCVSVYRTQG